MNENDAHRAATIEERHRRSRFYAPTASVPVPMTGVHIILIIVADARPTSAIGDSHQTPPFRTRGCNGILAVLNGLCGMACKGGRGEENGYGVWQARGR